MWPLLYFKIWTFYFSKMLRFKPLHKIYEGISLTKIPSWTVKNRSLFCNSRFYGDSMSGQSQKTFSLGTISVGVSMNFTLSSQVSFYVNKNNIEKKLMLSLLKNRIWPHLESTALSQSNIKVMKAKKKKEVLNGS